MLDQRVEEQWPSGDNCLTESGDWLCPNQNCRNHKNGVFRKKNLCPSCGASKPNDIMQLQKQKQYERNMCLLQTTGQLPWQDEGDWTCPNMRCANHTHKVFRRKQACPLCGSLRPDCIAPGTSSSSAQQASSGQVSAAVPVVTDTGMDDKLAAAGGIKPIPTSSLPFCLSDLADALDNFSLPQVQTFLKRARDLHCSEDEPRVKRACAFIRYEADRTLDWAHTLKRHGVLAGAQEQFAKVIDLVPTHAEASEQMSEIQKSLTRVKQEDDTENEVTDDFLLKVISELRDHGKSLAGKASSNCVFLVRELLDAMASHRLPGAPASSQRVEYRHWGAHVVSSDTSGDVEQYELDLSTSIPASLTPLLKGVLQWESDTDGSLRERLEPPTTLPLPSSRAADLVTTLQEESKGRTAFGIIVMPGKVCRSAQTNKERIGAGHVLAFHSKVDGTIQFVDPSQRVAEQQIFSDFTSQQHLYEACGLQTKRIFYLYCSGQMSVAAEEHVSNTTQQQESAEGLQHDPELA